MKTARAPLRRSHGSLTRQLWSAAWLALGALSLGAPAAASPEYTDTIRSALDLSCPPRCTLCHQDNLGGLGTIRPGSFGETVVRVADLEAGEPDRLRCALQLLDPACEEPPECATPDQTCLVADTDGDGVGDIEELRQTRDPNAEGEGFLCGAAYGCGAELSPPDPSSPALPLWLAAVVAAFAGARLRYASRRAR